MLPTLLGIVIFVKLVQEENAEFPITPTALPMVTSTRLVQK